MKDEIIEGKQVM